MIEYELNGKVIRFDHSVQSEDKFGAGLAMQSTSVMSCGHLHSTAAIPSKPPAANYSGL